MKQPYGSETWRRLLDWDKGQTASERLAALLLYCEGFQGIDPSHPLGGKDGLKDISLTSKGKKFIAACYFPRGQKEIKEIKGKFLEDFKGVEKNKVDGFIFVTNQELRLGERKELIESVNKEINVEIYHLERIMQRLETPMCYGLRMEYLQIPMTPEEQISFFNTRDQTISELVEEVKNISDGMKKIDVSLSQKQNDFQEMVNPITFSLSASLASGSLIRPENPFHRCSKCNYGMLITPTGNGYASSAYSPTKQYIRCKNCGNVDELLGHY